MGEMLVRHLLIQLCLLVTLATEEENVKLVETFDEQRMFSTMQINGKQQSLVDQVFGEIKRELEKEKATMLKLKTVTRNESAWIGGSQEAYEASKDAEIILTAYQKIAKKDKTIALSYISTNTIYKLPYPYCPNVPIITCNNCSTFRTYDGSCNNIDFAWWGKSETPDKRLLAAAYDDYVTEPRVLSVVPKKFLPNARKVAMSVFQPQPSVSEWSHFMTFFGQFVDHDATLTAQSTYADGFRKLCRCNSYDPDCFNIPTPSGDYANNDQVCMSFVRSMASVNAFNCFLSPREQLNIQTSWLDLSQLYGYYPSLTAKLRDVDGKLKVSVEKSKEFLPLASNASCTYNRFSSEYSRRQKCWLNGDPRAEDNSVLTSIQTVFLREHNRIVKKLKVLNPSWSSDYLFETTRKIVIAEYNNIVYSEFLPALLGTLLPKKYNLLPERRGYFYGYNPKVYPQVINEFATAAFRYGHTQVAYSAHSATRDYKLSDPRPFSYYLFNNEFYRSSMDEIIRGALVDSSYAPSSQTNAYFGDWLFNGLFFMDSKRWSLPALNIQRGRDHGLPGYNFYREKCGMKRAKTFEDLTNMPTYLIAKLKDIYASPDDIDLFAGLYSEFPMERALVGATAGCIIAKQFKDWKFGDRFYYETADPNLRFTKDQLESIRGVTMTQILCSNVDIDSIQQFAFFVAKKDFNILIDCKYIQKLDLDLWKNEEELSQNCEQNENASTTTSEQAKY